MYMHQKNELVTEWNMLSLTSWWKENLSVGKRQFMKGLTEKAEKPASRNKCELSRRSTDNFVDKNVVQAFL